jgi:hypothetical protein
MMTRTSRRNRYKQPNILDRVSLDWYLVIGSLLVIVQACDRQSFSAYCLSAAWLGLCATCIALVDKSSGNISYEISQFFRKNKQTRTLAVVFAVCGLTSLFVILCEPSQAQMLQGVEQSATTMFAPTTASDKTAMANLIKSLFNILRGGIIIAVVVILVKTFNARDDQEDMKSQFRPLIILFGITTVADYGAKFIAGSGAPTIP